MNLIHHLIYKKTKQISTKRKKLSKANQAMRYPRRGQKRGRVGKYRLRWLTA